MAPTARFRDSPTPSSPGPRSPAPARRLDDASDSDDGDSSFVRKAAYSASARRAARNRAVAGGGGGTWVVGLCVAVWVGMIIGWVGSAGAGAGGDKVGKVEAEGEVEGGPGRFLWAGKGARQVSAFTQE